MSCSLSRLSDRTLVDEVSRPDNKGNHWVSYRNHIKNQKKKKNKKPMSLQTGTCHTRSEFRADRNGNWR